MEFVLDEVGPGVVDDDQGGLLGELPLETAGDRRVGVVGAEDGDAHAGGRRPPGMDPPTGAGRMICPFGDTRLPHVGPPKTLFPV